MGTVQTDSKRGPHEIDDFVGIKTIDARGMACPGPLMNLIGAIRQGEVGQTFDVLSSDEGSKTDIPAWVAKAKHELVEVRQDEGFSHFVVKKVR